jgi:hypothetical protein
LRAPERGWHDPVMEAGNVPTTIVANSALGLPPGQLAGWSIREAAGTPAAALVRLRDGTVSGQILAEIALAASGEDTKTNVEVNYAPDAFVKVVSGTVEGVVYTHL